jgi:signal transduction histidine kinase
MKKPHHWTVRVNYRNRAGSFVMLFFILGLHLQAQPQSAWVWFFLPLQFLVYPHLMYWRARLSKDSRQAERNNLTVDSFLFGVWGVWLGFPLWVTFVMFISSTLHHVLYEGWRGGAISVAALGVGVSAALGVWGFHFAPEMARLPTLMCIVGFAVYLLVIAQAAHARNSILFETRAALRGSEQALQLANKSLQQQNAAKTRFLAYAGHDLRQPLQAMQLFLASLSNEGLDHKQAHLVRMVETSAHALGELLDSLLDISKLDAGAIQPELRPIDVDVFLTQLLQEFEPQAQSKGLRLKLWCPADVMTVVTDEKLLSSVMRNLIANAVKYTRKGGVLVAVRRGDNDVRLQVWDTGPGISPEHQQRMYEEFYQGDNPQRDRTQGLGLGLAIVRRICALLDLKISCRSRIGRGTVMEVVLPRSHAEAKGPAWWAEKSFLPNLQGLRFVVLEDSREVKAALTVWLESMGVTVSGFSRVEDALAAPDLLAADFFLSDYRLPGSMTGIDFLNAVQARSDTDIHGILLTGDTSTDFIEMATASGWPILFKPLQLEKFNQVLSHLLGDSAPGGVRLASAKR